jgi:hypothetical protein
MMLSCGTIQGSHRYYAGGACCGQTWTAENHADAPEEWTIYIFDPDHNLAEGAPHFYTGGVPEMFDHVSKLATLWGPLLSDVGVVERPARTWDNAPGLDDPPEVHAPITESESQELDAWISRYGG